MVNAICLTLLGKLSAFNEGLRSSPGKSLNGAKCQDSDYRPQTSD
jgi:hypothetical protein